MREVIAVLAACAALSCGEDRRDPGTSPRDGGGSPDTGIGALDCATYCAKVQANCTGGVQQYSAAAECMATCPAFTAGTAADTMGDTLGCRAHHAELAATNPATHCVHAGPGGGGVCGSNCNSACEIISRVCTGANQVYADAQACLNNCMIVPDTVRYDVSVTGPGSAACFVYYAQHASVWPSRCPRTLAATSTVCID